MSGSKFTNRVTPQAVGSNTTLAAKGLHLEYLVEHCLRSFLWFLSTCRNSDVITKTEEIWQHQCIRVFSVIKLHPQRQTRIHTKRCLGASRSSPTFFDQFNNLVFSALQNKSWTRTFFQTIPVLCHQCEHANGIEKLVKASKPNHHTKEFQSWFWNEFCIFQNSSSVTARLYCDATPCFELPYCSPALWGIDFDAPCGIAFVPTWNPWNQTIGHKEWYCFFLKCKWVTPCRSRICISWGVYNTKWIQIHPHKNILRSECSQFSLCVSLLTCVWASIVNEGNKAVKSWFVFQSRTLEWRDSAGCNFVVVWILHILSQYSLRILFYDTLWEVVA